MKRFLQICSFLVCMLVALPALAATSYSSFYISISDALINAKQGNDEQTQKAIDKFAENWASVTSEQKEAKRAVDDALNAVLKSSTQEERVKTIMQLSTTLSQLEKLENPVDEEAERKEFETKYTPFMRQFEEALATDDYEKILPAYNVLNGKWNQYEQPVRAQSVGMYGQIETQLAFIRITLASEDPDLPLVASQYAAFKASIEQFLAGEDIAVEEGSYSLQTLINHIDDALQAIDMEKFDEASDALTEFIIVWPNIEMEVSTRNSSLYTNLESDLPILVSELTKDTIDTDSITNQLSNFKTEIQLLQEDSDYTFLDSALILLREGLEALLIIMVLVSFLKKSNQEHMARWIYMGALLGVLVSAVAAVALSFIFNSLTVNTSREILEGYVGLIAAAMMIGVGGWLHNKSNVASWNSYLSKQMGQAISKQSVFAMATVSFLSVFREGAETIIFYVGIAPNMPMFDFTLGIIIALAILALVAFIFFKMSVRIQVHKFFFVATIFIYVLAFKIIGSSIHTLQLTNILPTTVIHQLPVFNQIGFYPTVETMAGQLILILIYVTIAIYNKTKNSNTKKSS
ncbi:FTR1 family iron permease [Bacillus sp. FJAT-27986]|uniref:FTR1 family iron permease n=1 Tax=Bacillus sp. FJAT-27986 TaxID=1743146 RepID=UPI00080AE7D6|nr:FTR1 family protein [Bacillus sp. FJAT-27986]OCA88635.1 transporter [Bacillus sp. FJAT-27986]